MDQPGEQAGARRDEEEAGGNDPGESASRTESAELVRQVSKVTGPGHGVVEQVLEKRLQVSVGPVGVSSDR